MEIISANHIMFRVVYPKITAVKILDFEEAISNSCGTYY